MSKQHKCPNCGHEFDEKADGHLFDVGDDEKPSELFEKFWKIYPAREGRKPGKKKAWQKFNKLPRRHQLLIIEAAEHYSASHSAKTGFARDAERFLQSDYWKDWVPAVEDAKKQWEIEWKDICEAKAHWSQHDTKRAFEAEQRLTPKQLKFVRFHGGFHAISYANDAAMSRLRRSWQDFYTNS